MRRGTFVLSALALASACAFAAPLRVPMDVVVNGQQRPGLVGWMDAGELWIGLEDARALGLKHLPPSTSIAGRAAVSVKALSPEVRFDENEARLVVTLDPGEIGTKSAVDLATIRNQASPVSVANGMVFDYELGAGGSASQRVLDVSTRLNSSFGGWQFIDERSASVTNGATRSFPIRTTLRRDWPENSLRLDVGTLDIPDPGIATWSSLRGVSFGSMVDGSISANAMRSGTSLTAPVKYPSTADVYVNGVRQGSFQVNPGTFDLQGLRGFAAGATDVRVVLRDMFGNETVLQQAGYVGDNTIRAGTQEFAYQAGVDPQQPDEGLQLRASHFLGVTNKLTLTAKAEARKRYAQMQAGFVLDLTRFGEVSAGVMRGHAADQVPPRGFYLSHLYAMQFWSSSTTLLSRPELALRPDGIFAPQQMKQLSTRQTWSAGDNQFLLALSTSRYADGTREHEYDVGWSRRLGSDVFMQTTFGHNNRLGLNAQVIFTWTPRVGYVGSSFTTTDRSGTMEQLSYSKSPAPGEATTWRVDARQQNGQRTYTGYAEQDLGIGSIKANAQASRDDNAWRLAWHSGIMSGYGLTTMRSNVSNSAVVVDAQGLPDVGVFRNGLRVGSTDAQGHYWISDLPGYEELRVSLDENAIPMDHWYSGSDVRAVRPAPGSVVGVRFDIRQVRTVDVTVHGVAQDQRLYFSSEGGAEVSALLKAGTAHVVGLLTGKQKVSTADGRCNGDTIVEKTGPVTVDMECAQ